MALSACVVTCGGVTPMVMTVNLYGKSVLCSLSLGIVSRLTTYGKARRLFVGKVVGIRLVFSWL